MKIGYIGNYRHEHCTEQQVAWALRHLGHEVVQIQEDEQASTDPGAVLVVLKQCDAVLYTRTWGLKRSWTRLWRRLESLGIPSASIHLDLFLGLDREKIVTGGDPLFTTTKVYTADGGHDERWAQLGVDHTWSPPAMHRPWARTGRRRGRFAHDVVFVGSSLQYHDEWPHRFAMVEALRNRYRDRFAIYGPGYETVRGLPLSDLYATAKVAVGDSLGIVPNYWSDRAYETLGRGGCLVHAHMEGMEAHFKDDVHLRYFDPWDFDTMFDRIDGLIADRAARDRLRAAGFEEVRASHLYDHRLVRVVDDLEAWRA